MELLTNGYECFIMEVEENDQEVDLEEFKKSLIMPEGISAGCTALLNSMFELEPTKRPTFSEICLNPLLMDMHLSPN